MAQTKCCGSALAAGRSVMSQNENNMPNSIKCSLLRPQTNIGARKIAKERALFGGLATKSPAHLFRHASTDPTRQVKLPRSLVAQCPGDYGVPLPSWMKSRSGSSIMDGTKGEELEPTARPEIKEARAKAEAEDAANAAALENILNQAAKPQTGAPPNVPLTTPPKSSVPKAFRAES
eukprot:70154-Pyramimonas_sp.AAC.2